VSVLRAIRECSPATLVLVAALPFLFLHPTYQPSRHVGAVTWNLTDVAVIAIAAAAALAVIRRADARRALARTWMVWLALGLFLLWALASLSWAHANDAGYHTSTRVVSVLKLVELALLAPAAAALLRSAADRRAVTVALCVWSAFLSAIAALQFLGLVNEFEGRRPVQREPSYIGVHELGAVSAATLCVGLVALLSRRWRLESKLAIAAGAIGVALAAALDAVGGLVVAAVVAALAAARRRALTIHRLLALAFVVALVAVASVTLRASAISAFAQFIGIQPASAQTTDSVQSYAHRTLLGYIGVQMWLDHPVIGAGWQVSLEPGGFRPYLAAAHRRFPDEPPAAFPSAEHPWGVQNGIIQTLSDLGLVGLALLAAALVAGARVAWRAAAGTGEQPDEGAIALGWLIAAAAVFTGTGLLPGSSIEALLWLSLGAASSLPAGSPGTPSR
jgi:O-antigen ligase